jgi:hypothetical protein
VHALAPARIYFATNPKSFTRVGPCSGAEHTYQHPFLAVSSSARGAGASCSACRPDSAAAEP